jgi:hypothetical protein
MHVLRRSTMFIAVGSCRFALQRSAMFLCELLTHVAPTERKKIKEIEAINIVLLRSTCLLANASATRQKKGDTGPHVGDAPSKINAGSLLTAI